jgi:mono/diheme cytochrome c family protein
MLRQSLMLPGRRRAPPRFVARLIAPLGIAPLGIALVAGCGRGPMPLPVLDAPVDAAALIERGEYVVRSVAVCGHCHAADPQNDPDGALTGGYEFRNWRIGSIPASNLTPDPETGLGEWSDAEIVRALRTGQRREGGVLAPVMPYAWYNGMSDDDALAVARYLRSLEPRARAHQRRPNLVFRSAQLLFLGPERAPDGVAPARGPTAEYGAYLARHVASCADCHTPRSGMLATPDTRRLFAGRADAPPTFPAPPPNLTPDTATGIGAWNEDDFMRAMRTGVTPAGDTLDAFMPWPQYRRMTDDDLRAIYRFLRTLPPIAHEVPRRR